MRPDARPSPLARYLLAAYALLVAYGSLYRITGWRDAGTSPFEFLFAPWPPYITGFDVAANIIAYVPLGLLGVLAAAPRLVNARAWFAATTGGLALSFAMEALQTYLPDRFESNVDLAANALGAAIGATAGVIIARWLALHGGLYALRDEVFHPGRQTDLGLVLIGLWLFALLNPETLLFGNGDLRDLFESLPETLHPAWMFVRIEGAVTAANLIAVALLTGALMPSREARWRLVVALLVGACLIRSAAYATLFRPADMFAWLTPGALWGARSGSRSRSPRCFFRAARRSRWPACC
ncbi:MAG: VanZ family protein [Gammaproteobacteria bacterium]|nr:VanZ family protein [Gammaproteobacteria bacterium]